MRPLLPVTWGTVGLMFALFANGLFLLGVDAEPATADGPRPLKAVAVTGSLMGGVTLTVMSLWFVVAGPLGSDTTTVVQLQLLYSAIGLTYGMHLLGTAVVQVKDWDLRIVGNLGLLAAGLTLLWCASWSATRAPRACRRCTSSCRNWPWPPSGPRASHCGPRRTAGSRRGRPGRSS